MNYRRFGKTGLDISILGFGCMRLPIIGQDPSRIDEEKAMEMVHYAVDKGVNYFDTAYPYHTTDFAKGGSSEPFLAKALKSTRRQNIYIATKLPYWLIQSRQDMDRYLDEQLRRLETETIDFYLLHGLRRAGWDNLTKHGVLRFLDRALASGKIKYAGFSHHDDADLFKEIVDAYPWTFCQIQYNYFDENFQAGREGLMYAVEKGLAVVVMEPLRGGSLVDRLPPAAKQVLAEAAPGRSLAAWGLQWVWNHPEVSVVLSGMSNPDQVKENVALAEKATKAVWSDKDAAALETAVGIIRELQKVDCTACGYCLPCPEGVNIPQNFALYNDHFVFNDPASKMRYRTFLGEKAKASNCTQCGQCEEQCPQQISIRKELEQVAALFG